MREVLTYILSKEGYEVIGAGDIVPHKKPAADIYFYVLQQMHLDAADCVAFEDSYNGILATRDAELKTIITYNGYTAEDDFSGASLVLDQIGDPGNPSRLLQQSYQQDYLTVELIQQIVHSDQ